MVFGKFREKMESLGARLQNIRVWQNGRTIYSRYNEEDDPKPIGNKGTIDDFLLAYGEPDSNSLTCALLEKYGLKCLDTLKRTGNMRGEVYDADNGQACMVFPEINAVVAINTPSKDQCAIAVKLINDIVYPDLKDHPRDNSLLNFLDTIYDDE